MSDDWSKGADIPIYDGDNAIAWIRLEITEPVQHEDLCTTCWKPSVWRMPIVHLTDDGVGDAGAILYCDDCELMSPA